MNLQQAKINISEHLKHILDWKKKTIARTKYGTILLVSAKQERRFWVKYFILLLTFVVVF
jgi:hypothetical protein